MTTFGKILLGLMLATAAVLVVRGHKTPSSEMVPTMPAETASTTTPSSTDLGGSFSGSMNDLIARGGDYKCTFDQLTEVSHSTGTVVISGKNVRGDFITEVKAVSGMKVGSHMISDGEFIYTWSDMISMGMKFKVAAAATGTSTPSSASNQNFNYNQKLDYQCTPTTRDASLFVVPATITFSEPKS